MEISERSGDTVWKTNLFFQNLPLLFMFSLSIKQYLQQDELEQSYSMKLRNMNLFVSSCSPEMTENIIIFITIVKKLNQLNIFHFTF